MGQILGIKLIYERNGSSSALKSGSNSIFVDAISEIKKMTEVGFKRNFWVQSKCNAITDDYTFGPKIGEGTYGHVYKAVNKVSKKEVAIKQIARSHVKNFERLKHEIEILKLVDHPNIVRVLEVYEDARNICFVMELCQGGELFDAIQKCGKF